MIGFHCCPDSAAGPSKVQKAAKLEISNRPLMHFILNMVSGALEVRESSPKLHPAQRKLFQSHPLQCRVFHSSRFCLGLLQNEVRDQGSERINIYINYVKSFFTTGRPTAACRDAGMCSKQQSLFLEKQRHFTLNFTAMSNDHQVMEGHHKLQVCRRS